METDHGCFYCREGEGGVTNLGAQPGFPEFLDGDLSVVVVVERFVALLVTRIVFQLFAQELKI